MKDSTRDITLRELIGLLYPRRSISAMWALGLLSVALTVGIQQPTLADPFLFLDRWYEDRLDHMSW